MSGLETLALASGLVCALAPLAQAARIGATGSARDVSLIWLFLYGAGAAVWLAYGVAIDSLPLIASQATALASVGIVFATAARHRGGNASEEHTGARRSGQRPPVPMRHGMRGHLERAVDRPGVRR